MNKRNNLEHSSVIDYNVTSYSQIYTSKNESTRNESKGYFLAHLCEKDKRSSAFTLAEVLITLGIIGVVAALTIPSLITNYKAHRLRSQFLKSYSVVQQVFKQMEADDVSLDPAYYARHSGSFYTLFKNYLTGVTDCGTWTTKASPCAMYLI